MLERYLIRYFIAVVDHGSFPRAAEFAHVSQPTLSAGIAKLKRLVGVPLFIRDSRRVELTAAGARMVDFAREIEFGFVEVEGIASEEVPAQRLRVGIASTIPSSITGDAVEAARLAEPEAQLVVMDGRMSHLLQRLDRGRLDVVIGPVPPSREMEIELGHEDYAMALPANHLLAQRTSVRPEELGGETMLVRRQCEVLACPSSKHLAQIWWRGNGERASSWVGF